MSVKLPYQNQVLIVGRLTRDPDFKSTQKGKTFCFFDIASNRRYKDNATGEWKDDTTFVPIAVWGDIADRCKDRIKKGTPVYIEGRLSMSEYTNKDGINIKKLRVVANRVQILESSKDESPDATDTNEGHSDKVNESDDEIPF
ncbi:MAG: single-stranded DNA-binding protein [Elusimicrobia bacterium]|jgi:single-strand DNA-binding protein|nr:single-stranded DNA-binding protein [Elusimicrobiota bacterium]